MNRIEEGNYFADLASFCHQVTRILSTTSFYYHSAAFVCCGGVPDGLNLSKCIRYKIIGSQLNYMLWCYTIYAFVITHSLTS